MDGVDMIHLLNDASVMVFQANCYAPLCMTNQSSENVQTKTMRMDAAGFEDMNASFSNTLPLVVWFGNGPAC